MLVKDLHSGKAAGMDEAFVRGMEYDNPVSMYHLGLEKSDDCVRYVVEGTAGCLGHFSCDSISVFWDFILEA